MLAFKRPNHQAVKVKVAVERLAKKLDALVQVKAGPLHGVNLNGFLRNLIQAPARVWLPESQRPKASGRTVA